MPATDKLSSDARHIFESALTLAKFKRMVVEHNVETEGIPPLHEALSTDPLKDLIRQKGLLAVGDIVEMQRATESYTEDKKKAIVLVASTAIEMLESDENSTPLVAPIVSTFGAAHSLLKKRLVDVWVRKQCTMPDTFKNMIALMVHQVMAFENTGIRKEMAIERELFNVYKSFKLTDHSTTFKAANTPGGVLYHDADSDWSIVIEHAPEERRPWRLTVMFKDPDTKRKVYIRQTAFETKVPTQIVWEWFADKAFQGAAKHACSLWLTDVNDKIAFWTSFWGGEGKVVEKSHPQLIMGARPFVDVANSHAVF